MQTTIQNKKAANLINAFTYNIRNPFFVSLSNKANKATHTHLRKVALILVKSNKSALEI